MSQIKKPESKESGQVTILVLALALALLTTIPSIAAVANLVISQQRLNSAADSIALAGAMELEFNQDIACETARNFKVDFPESIMRCEASESRIKVSLESPNTVFPTKYLLPTLVANATAGIAQTIKSMP